MVNAIDEPFDHHGRTWYYAEHLGGFVEGQFERPGKKLRINELPSPNSLDSVSASGGLALWRRSFRRPCAAAVSLSRACPQTRLFAATAGGAPSPSGSAIA